MWKKLFKRIKVTPNVDKLFLFLFLNSAKSDSYEWKPSQTLGNEHPLHKLWGRTKPRNLILIGSIL